MLPFKCMADVIVTKKDGRMMESSYRRGYDHGLCTAYDIAKSHGANMKVLDALSAAEEIAFEFRGDGKPHNPMSDHIWQELHRRKNQAKNSKPRPDKD